MRARKALAASVAAASLYIGCTSFSNDPAAPATDEGGADSSRGDAAESGADVVDASAGDAAEGGEPCPNAGVSDAGSKLCDDFNAPAPLAFWTPQTTGAATVTVLADLSAPSAPNVLRTRLNGASTANLAYVARGFPKAACSVLVNLTVPPGGPAEIAGLYGILTGTTRRYLSVSVTSDQKLTATVSDVVADGGSLNTTAGSAAPIASDWQELRFAFDKASVTVVYAGKIILSAPRSVTALDDSYVTFGLVNFGGATAIDVRYDDVRCQFAP